MASVRPTTLGRAFSPARDAQADFVQSQAQRDVLASLFGDGVSPRTFDRFELEERVGAGAMGTVYAAHDPKLNRRIALKILRTSDEHARRRHLAEARALARLDHPGVVAVFDAGECDGHLYVAMEFVQGESLRGWLDRGALSTHERLEVFAQASAGLHAAHRAGIVHRDFKPANVLVSRDDTGALRVRVADFGLATDDARDLQTRDGKGDDDDASGATTGNIVGTPLYMAPEQMQGRPVTALSDRFALCVSMYEALVGVLPFPGPSRAERLAQIRNGPPAAGRRCPTWVASVLRRGMAWDPAQRFGDLAAVRDALLRRPRRRRRAMVAGFVVAAGAGAYALGRGTTPDPCAEVDHNIWALWGEPQRQAIHEAFTTVGVPYGEATANSVVASLDRYTQDLAATQRQSCRQSWSKTQGAALPSGLDRCLGGLRTELAATIDVLGRGYAETPSNAHRIVGALPPVADCQGIDTQPARAEALSPEVAAAEASLATLRAELGARRPNLALPAQRLAEAVDALAYGPLQARAAALVAAVARRDGERVVAEQNFRRSLWLAEAAGQARTAGYAAVSLGRLEAADHLRLDRARDWLDLARALYRRAGDPEGLNAGVMLAEAQLALAQRDPQTMVEWTKRVLEEYPGGVRLRLDALNLQASGYEALGQLEAASRTYQEALALVGSEYGDGHAHQSALQTNYGSMLYQLGHTAHARQLLRSAAATTEASYGRLHPRTASVWSNLAGTLDDGAEANALRRAALKAFTHHYGDRHAKVAMMHVNLATGLLGAGDAKEALLSCDAAEAALPAEADGALKAWVDLCRADTLVALGRAEEAVATLAPLATDPTALDASLAATVPFSYGKALFAVGQRAAAVQWVRTSVPRYQGVQGSSSPQRTAPETWLAEHGE